MNNSLFIFGQGYVGKYLVNQLQWPFFATHRNQNIIFHESQNEIDNQQLRSCTHVLISIPPINGQDIVYQHMLEVLQSAPNLKWLGYLSTIGVYGNTDGAWVDETASVQATEPHSVHRQEIEQLWLTTNLPVHIFRLGAIYGPGRSVIEQIRENSLRVIHREGQVFNRIHVEDICQTLQKSMENPTAGEIYNLVDDYPSSSKEVAEFACELLAANMPAIEDYQTADISEYHRSYFKNCRRVRNDKIKKKLNVQLRYPNYKAGLMQIAEA